MTLPQIKEEIKSVKSGSYKNLCIIDFDGKYLQLINKFTGAYHPFPNGMYKITIPENMSLIVRKLIE